MCTSVWKGAQNERTINSAEQTLVFKRDGVGAVPHPLRSTPTLPWQRSRKFAPLSRCSKCSLSHHPVLFVDVCSEFVESLQRLWLTRLSRADKDTYYVGLDCMGAFHASLAYNTNFSEGGGSGRFCPTGTRESHSRHDSEGFAISLTTGITVVAQASKDTHMPIDCSKNALRIDSHRSQARPPPPAAGATSTIVVASPRRYRRPRLYEPA